ncbi:hypothetical protein ACFFKU_10905 [Kineococcus gynurae]|uniref:5-bromo-4-chloroindolyl phosphate hydrolysis protein n=1 Tax=Kineococcus gynurae TaxID=452979 RepID=A0ABV5LUS1_9ACTN
MGVDLSKPGSSDEDRERYGSDRGARDRDVRAAIDREIVRAIDGGSGGDHKRAELVRLVRENPDAVSDKRLEKADPPVDESRLTPLGVQLPNGPFLGDGTWQVLRWTGMGVWITLYSLTGLLGGQWWWGFIAMWIWIGADRAYDNASKAGRMRRKRELRALRLEALGGPPADIAPAPAALRPAPSSRAPAPAPAAVPRTGSGVTEAERSLLRAVTRVERSDRFERRDVVLVNEIADVLAPLLHKVAQPGADARVRHDLETLATDHLPATVETFLALPADYAREHVTSAGTTAVQELRSQLTLLHDGVVDLRDAVLDADVDRQLQQSRFLEAKFRRSDLDL